MTADVVRLTKQVEALARRVEVLEREAESFEAWRTAFRREYLLLREVADFAAGAVARSIGGVEVKPR